MYLFCVVDQSIFQTIFSIYINETGIVKRVSVVLHQVNQFQEFVKCKDL